MWLLSQILPVREHLPFLNISEENLIFKDTDVSETICYVFSSTPPESCFSDGLSYQILQNTSPRPPQHELKIPNLPLLYQTAHRPQHHSRNIRRSRPVSVETTTPIYACEIVCHGFVIGVEVAPVSISTIYFVEEKTASKRSSSDVNGRQGADDQLVSRERNQCTGGDAGY